MNTQPATPRTRTHTFMEHRWGQRVPVDLPVHVTAGASNGIGLLRDASISGGYVETRFTATPLTSLAVVVLVGVGPAHRAVELPACVTRVTADGFAVEWRDMACPAVVALLRGCGAELDHLTARDRAFS